MLHDGHGSGGAGPESERALSADPYGGSSPAGSDSSGAVRV